MPQLYVYTILPLSPLLPLVFNPSRRDEPVLTYLLSTVNDTPDGWIPIIYLGDNSEHDLYCCGNIIVNGSDVACKHGEEPFSLDTGTVMFKSAMLADTTQGSGSGGSNNNNNNINNNNGNNDTDNNNNNNINNNSCNNDSNNNNNNDVNNGTSATSGPSACPSVSQLSPSSSSNKVAVGVGVGVSLGVVAVAAVAWALWERRARMRQWHGKEPMPFGLGEKAAVSSSSRVPLQRSPAELGAESPRIVELASDRRF